MSGSGHWCCSGIESTRKLGGQPPDSGLHLAAECRSQSKEFLLNSVVRPRDRRGVVWRPARPDCGSGAAATCGSEPTGPRVVVSSSVSVAVRAGELSSPQSAVSPG